MVEERKLVSVIFADVVGSTSLGDQNDPEVVRAVLGRYFERVEKVVETHGGSVEKFIGDAAMAVFGVPSLHDDDAERAVRAALAIRDAVTELNESAALQLQARIGVNTGEVVAAADDRRQFMVTGDVVNVAARLQQGAAPGEVVVGALTEQLTRRAIEYRSREAIEARGKPEPITAFAAIAARSAVPEQARGLPEMRSRLVGRTTELSLLIDTFERSRRDGRAQLFTIIGSAGVGKSRLVGEFLAKAAGQAEVVVLRGRCLPYGTGITYWPLLEVLQADLGVSSSDTRSEALARLDRRVASVIGPEAERAAVRNRLAVLLGLAEVGDALPDVDPARLPAELGWGLARHLEAVAAGVPVIVVIDDLQWAEPPVVEILRGLLDRTADVPILVVSIGRPELVERHPTWGAGQSNATLIALEPLSADETRTLIGRLLDVDDLPEALRSQIIARAAGNPLFCEEFVRMLIEEGRLVRQGDRWRAAGAGSLDVRVPESIHALLAARLDAVSAEPRRLLQTASVIGEQFDAAQLLALSGVDGFEEHLERLSRGGFIVADRRGGPGAYRFRHLLIRDVAYTTLPKSERARLHEVFGKQLEAAAADRREELVEILAYHAERAFALAVELRLASDGLAERGRRALELALDAADRALETENRPAIAAFLETARRVEDVVRPLAPADAARLSLLAARRAALEANYPVARHLLLEAADAALSAGQPALAAQAHLALIKVILVSASEDDAELLGKAFAEATRLFDVVGDIKGRLEVQGQELERYFHVGDLTRMIRDGTRIAEEAESAGALAVAAQILGRLANVAGWLGEIDLAYRFADRADALVARLGLIATGRWVRFYRARLAWIRNRLPEAEREVRSLIDELQDVGDPSLLVAAIRLLGETLYQAGRIDEAEVAWRNALELSLHTGERWSRTELLAFVADCATARGDHVDAERLLAESQASLREGDVAAVAGYNGALARLRAAQGRHGEAEAGFRKAFDVSRGTEYWYWRIAALDLADFLATRGRTAEAAALVTEVADFMADRDLIGRSRFERLRAQVPVSPRRSP